MRSIAFSLAIGLATVSCSTPFEPDQPCQCGLGEVCYDGSCVSPDGKADLPNSSFNEGPHDGRGYAAIARWLANAGYSLQVDLTQLDLVWPLASGQSSALNRFGTPIQISGRGYFHTALDVIRSATTDSAEVRAPVTGTAFVFDWYGARGYNTDPYSTVLAIWDPASHVIVQLMHVEPSASLIAAGMQPVEVTRGEVIGTLALGPVGTAQVQEYFRHTHVDIVDGEHMIALDPSRYLPYQDTVAPVQGEVYVLDSSAAKHTSLRTGPLDVIVELSDRDDTSARNFEVTAISYEILLDGQLIKSSPRCELGHLIDKIGTPYVTYALRLIDFGNAAGQITGDWPNADIGNPDRTFRYALTQFAVHPSGRCMVGEDADGFVDVPATADAMTVRVTAWDHNDNATTTETTLAR
ncbi:MAG: hypothetical protein AB7O24_15840 [Kofleriaceae bacterium]